MIDGMDSNFTVAQNIHWRRYEQGGILLNTHTSEVFKINESGIKIWELLMKGHNPQEVVPMIVRESLVETTQAKMDVEGFVASMLEVGVLCSCETVDRIDIENGHSSSA